MPIQYKIDLLAALKAAGYSTTRLRREKIFGEATMQKFRRKEPMNFANLEKLCCLLDCQPGDILEYIPEERQRGEREC